MHRLAVQELRQLFRHGEMEEGDVVGVLHDAGLAVGGTGSRDAGVGHVVQREPAFREELLRQSGHVRTGRLQPVPEDL